MLFTQVGSLLPTWVNGFVDEQVRNVGDLICLFLARLG